MPPRKTGATRMTTMTGRTNNPKNIIDPVEVSLSALFRQQMDNQGQMLDDGMYDAFKSCGTKDVPVDDVKLMSYHIQQLMSEIGEILDADKRWKNFRNQKYDKDAKLEEIADCFIVMMNIAMFSGFDGGEVTQAIIDKLNRVSNRIFNK